MLLEKGLIKEDGRGTGPGRPVLYATTNGFLEYFGLADLKDLPALEVLRRP
jgi:segregation and condensation protein B